jgi:alkylation response protein AidB-like acyl-CoA dehydrogenase
VVDALGNAEQRQRILGDTINMDKYICFGLTEPLNGSDASGLQTSVKKVDGGYLVTGQKRWIGNATFADYINVWARNPDDGNKIQCFVVTKGSKGLITEKIENKYSLRIVQNTDITMKDVFVPEHNKLEHAKDFQTGTNAVLEASRLGVAWLAAGIAVGAYESALKYCLKRKQFGKVIASYQLIQEKLSRMLSLCEMMLSNLILVSQAMERKETTIGQVGRVKASCTRLGREVTSLAREVCGGNGILLENQVMKHHMDIEAIHTYEGTYEVNSLVSGRELTGGISAIRSKK